MIPPQKRDAGEIAAFIEFLKRQPWLGEARVWWPGSLFRIDNVDQAASILKMGKMLSRNEAEKAGLIKTDAASSSVISITSPKWKDHVRLYFRPRTPTQFRNEGMRPKDQQAFGAHMPMPVVLIFDAEQVLTREDSLISNGNLARKQVQTGGDSAFLKSIPFEKVYHDDAVAGAVKDEIVFHRHAEAAIPHELNLDALRGIYCRSQAEFETLLSCLDIPTRKRWAIRIGLDPSKRLFEKMWTFIEEVRMNTKEIALRFNASSQTPGPFHLFIAIEETMTGITYSCKEDAFMSSRNGGRYEISLRKLRDARAYLLKVTLDGNLAYSGSYVDENVPF